MSLLSKLASVFSSDPAQYVPPQGIPSPAEARTLELYKFDTCPFCQRVMVHAKKIGVTEIAMRDTRRDANAKAELLRLTQGTQVPCLVIDGSPLLESKDINLWLDAYAFHHK